jgi:hypothetical protein
MRGVIGVIGVLARAAADSLIPRTVRFRTSVATQIAICR